jgi:phosphoribosyl 1,2-cyclic phosphodiesterase
MQINVLASSSKANCTHIDDGATQLLLDAGVPIRQLRERLSFGLSKVEAALITHCHQDHCRAVPDLLAAGMGCYMLPHTAESLGVTGHHRVRPIMPRRRFEIGTWGVMPFETPHDVENVGFVLSSTCGEKVLYLTDTPYCHFRFVGLTRILIEANYDLPVLRDNVLAGRVNHEVKRRVLRSHMSLDTLCGFLCANDLSRVRQIILLHLSSDSSDAARFKKTIQALTGVEVIIA